MKNHSLPLPGDEDHRVLQFQPRIPPSRALAAHGRQLPPVQTDLSRYEHGGDESPDDFSHRMLTNIAGLVVTIVLTAIGFWLATSIADLRKTQDCVLMGRRDCANIAILPG
ncbi:hypothetical protein [Rhodopseudomonas pseudopalustris]|uniref:Uncharacterized protein n=1 Tax=Rhodopseudomonas pseudopalustris TaxID=1513892 RepID=A0A1H8S9W9_9BRAD|nr:hypothetical protein [Rhodopseudomonas pseudopalustris]SEO75461.1 hypothetical protein SAMN05444123_104367 [Rhodopseudomonas pseudopalustris]